MPQALPDVSEMFSETWALFKGRFAVLMLVGGIGALASVAAVAVPLAVPGLAWAVRPGVSWWLWGAAGAVGLTAAFWIVSWAQVAMIEALLGSAGAVECYRAAWTKVTPFSWVCLLFMLAVAGGASWLVVPGVYLAVALMFAPYACAAEGETGFSALIASLDYTRGRWLGLAGRLLLVGLATSVPSFVPVIGPALGAVLAPFGLANTAVLYQALRRAGRVPAASPDRAKGLLMAAIAGLLIPGWIGLRTAAALRAAWPQLAQQAQSLQGLDPASMDRLRGLLGGLQP